MPIDWTGYISITQWEKYRLDGLPKRKFANPPLMGLDMMEHLANLRWTMAHPNEVNPTEEQCRFCKSKPHCPLMSDADG